MKDVAINKTNIEDFDYKLVLYDHNAHIKELDKNDVIIIGKDGYDILYYKEKEKENTLSENDDFIIT
jgi:hypothetical protein